MCTTWCAMENNKIDSIVELAGKIAGMADDIDEILVIYSKKKGGLVTLDNDLTVSTCIFMIEAFKFWTLSCMAKDD